MSVGMVQCDQCQKVVKTSLAHGWYSLKTIVAVPTKEQMRGIDPDILSMHGLSADDGQDSPVKVGGEFCSTPCLRNYVDSADMLMGLGGDPA